MDPNLVQVTEIFLVPTSILIGAFSIASTEPLKTSLSIICVIIAIMWIICVYDAWPPYLTLGAKTLAFFPILFFASAIISTCVHSNLWYQQTKKAAQQSRPEP